MLPLLLAFQAASAQQPAFNGFSRQLDVAVPRAEATVQVDGVLDEPVWRRAAMLTGFSQYRPVDSRAADDSTQVLVWYAPDAIHFGVRAFEAHGSVVRATLADRDNIGADDRVQLLLDTYNDNRRALLFAINPLGVQQDGVQSEGFDPTQSAGGRFDGVVDISPDFVFESKGRVTGWGYEIEIRIPFKSIRYQSNAVQDWGIQVTRFTQHSGYEDTWTPAVRASASFLIQSGRLKGLTGLRRGLVMDVAPEFTSRVDGAPGATDYAYGRVEPGFGANLRWGISQNASLTATANPDFSQVEADVGQVTVNERFTLFFPEKRPFFLEGLEQFGTPNQLIYTRRIQDPVFGVKVTGKVRGTDVAYLAAADDDRLSASGATPVFNLLRLRRDLGATSTLGMAYTDRIEGDDYNRVFGADARLVWKEIWFSQVQVVGSWTRDPGGARTGAIWNITFADRTGRSYGNHYELTGISPEFEAQSGFVPRTGVVAGAFANRFSWYGRPGALVEQLTTFTVLTPLWRYDEFPSTNTFEGAIVSTWLFTLRGGWGANANLSNAHQRFDSTFYAGYRVDRGVDTIPLGHPKGLYNLWGANAGFNTPSRALTLGGQMGYGASVIFAEAARARQFFLSAGVHWRPTASVRVEGQWFHQRITRARDGSRFSTANIPRLKVEYQLNRSMFFRYVGQYFSQDRTALRAARTGQPLLLPGYAAAQFGPNGPFVVNDFRNDFLFSYKPTPGTVVFFGYGASLSEPNSFAFDMSQLNRTADGFFLKVSYLYRL
jgi:uncharacterized protein DUF5916